MSSLLPTYYMSIKWVLQAISFGLPQSPKVDKLQMPSDILSFIPISGDLARFFVSYMMLYKVVPPKIAKLVYNSTNYGF